MSGSDDRSSNVEQAEQWGGEEGRSWIAHRHQHDRMVAALTPKLLAAAAIEPADRVLDVGCGCGETTGLAAQQASAGRVLGVDISAPMIDAASQQAEMAAVRNVSFLTADAQTHRFEPESFEVVMSRFGVMFFDSPLDAFSNLTRAMTRRGRLAFLTWQEALKNEWIVVAGAALAAHTPLTELSAGGPGPFSLADPARTRSLLDGAGLTNITIEQLSEPVCLGSDVEEAIGYLESLGVVRAILASLDQNTVRRIESDVAEALRPYAGADGIMLGSASWLVSARRP